MTNVSLTSPMPHPARPDHDRGTQQEAAGGERRDQMLGNVLRSGEREDRECEHRAGDRQLVRDDPVVEVDHRDRHEQQHEREPEPDVLVRAEDHAR